MYLYMPTFAVERVLTRVMSIPIHDPRARIPNYGDAVDCCCRSGRRISECLAAAYTRELPTRDFGASRAVTDGDRSMYLGARM